MELLEAALLAEAAYTATPLIGRESGAARAIVSPDHATIGFPGTDNIATWLADLDVLTTYSNSLGELHAGFWRAYCAVRAPLLGMSPSVVYGHSEGAALALLYAADLCVHGRPPAQVFAFEPPRVSCDRAMERIFASHPECRTALTQKGEDVVPMVPRLVRAWRHPAALMRFGAATWPWPNTDDHPMAGVIAAIRGLPV